MDEYMKSLLAGVNISSPISQLHRTASSYAFFMRPNLRLLKVTWRRRKSVIRFIAIFFRPI
jgi:hypothetical protein